jgi:nitric oxide dioxygenase
LNFVPGQYLTLVSTIQGDTVRRNYSLSQAPGQNGYRISVKREPGGRVSNWLHDEAVVGTQVQVMPPSGDFMLRDGDRPLVLVTAGAGITPAMSMLEATAATGRAITFVHAARNSGTHAFRGRVDEVARAHPNVQTCYIYDTPLPQDQPQVTGLITQALLQSQLGSGHDVDLYLVGPKPFMQTVYAAAHAIGIPSSQIHFEFFGPVEDLTADQPR